MFHQLSVRYLTFLHCYCCTVNTIKQNVNDATKMLALSLCNNSSGTKQLNQRTHFLPFKNESILLFIWIVCKSNRRKMSVETKTEKEKSDELKWITVLNVHSVTLDKSATEISSFISFIVIFHFPKKIKEKKNVEPCLCGKTNSKNEKFIHSSHTNMQNCHY